MRNIFIATSLITVSLLSACSEGRPDFEYSCDVSTDGWGKSDTLTFPFHYPFLNISDTEAHSESFPQTLALHLAFRYRPCLDMEDLSLHMRLIADDGKAISGYKLKCQLTDDKGIPQGTGWGSLTTHEIDDLPYSIVLPDTGIYKLLVWPEKETGNIFSITMGLTSE